MLVAALLALQAATLPGLCLDPDETIPANRRLLDAGEPCRKRAAPRDNPDTTPVSAELKAKITRQFDAVLVDGPTTRWRWPSRTNSTKIYCGWLNSKNRMGGYTGWTLYAALLEEPFAVTLADDESYKLISDTCRRSGYDVSGPPLE